MKLSLLILPWHNGRDNGNQLHQANTAAMNPSVVYGIGLHRAQLRAVAIWLVAVKAQIGELLTTPALASALGPLLSVQMGPGYLQVSASISLNCPSISCVGHPKLMNALQACIPNPSL